MATTQPRRAVSAPSIVNTQDIAARSAPTSSKSVWVLLHERLFRTPVDAVLTLVMLTLAGWVVWQLTVWAVAQANWLVIHRNLTTFMVGTYPREAIWRVWAVAALVVLATGFTWATFVRAGRSVLAGFALLVALAYAVPAVAQLAPPPATVLSAGDVTIASGTETRAPLPALAFVGRGSEAVRLVLPALADDTQAEALHGFGDDAMNLFRNAAINRRDMLARAASLSALLDLDARTGNTRLSEAQRAAFTAERDTLTATDMPPVTQALAANTVAVALAISRADGEVVASTTLAPGDAAWTVTLPADGWYVLTKTVAAPGALALLNVEGLYPLVRRDVSQPMIDADGEPVITRTGRIQTRTITENVRVTDGLVITAARPTLDGQNVPLMQLTDFQYRGLRPVQDYLTLGVAPFLEQIATPLLALLAVGLVGYGAGVGTQIVAPDRPGLPRRAANQVIMLALWTLAVFAAFTLVLGVDRLNGALLGTLLANVVWVGVMFFVGTHQGGRAGRALTALGLLLLLVTLVLWRLQHDTRPFLASTTTGQGIALGGWGLSADFWLQFALWLAVGVMAARMGAANQPLLRTRGRVLGLVVVLGLWAALLFGTPLAVAALGSSGVLGTYAARNLLPVAPMNLWGGLLLTMMLTVVGIVASFPLGVLLALGRRAHRYPIIQWTCIAFIELVRGVPLITVLFMATLLLPLVNPALATVPNVVRAMVGITLFSAAYLAENVRGGLQSVPPGQDEAARAVGLNGVQVVTLITLPQALRAVIPALVGQCIALFKDTSLVAIVGLADLTRVANNVTAQPEYVGRRLETYLFISAVYFVFSYVMAVVSRRIEASGSGATRRS